MPVRAVGKNIVEVDTGKVVGHSKSRVMAKKAARVRNAAHYAKKKGKRAYNEFKETFGD